jgi:hypothetical protein
MKCLWCKGTGEIRLVRYVKIRCLNCKGIGEGRDGDDTPVTGQKKPWMIGNKYGVGNKSKSSGKETEP